VPAILAPQGQLVIGPLTCALLAGCVAAWRTHNVFWTIVGGVAAFWLFHALTFQCADNRPECVWRVYRNGV
jgi:branched-subunit amino acid transport protein